MNLLKRGADPYADADVTDARTGLIPFHISATEWAAGGTKFLANPFKGRVRELVAVVVVANSANASVLGVQVGTETLGSVTVASAAAAGVRYQTQINDDADDFNEVDANDVIAITFDGAPSAGAVDGYVRVSAASQ